ncbi:Transcription repressor OFP13 [Spatholobus suberectus]|nr:Transcription repressor OFP13 [Spatholobus suberectus]
MPGEGSGRGSSYRVRCSLCFPSRRRSKTSLSLSWYWIFVSLLYWIQIERLLEIGVRSSSSSWAWPSCHQPKTLSFRAAAAAVATTTATVDDVVLKPFNSPFVDETPESFFTESPNSVSFSTASDESRGRDPIETVIRGLRSDRLFFEPDETSSILEAKLTSHVPFKNSVVLSMDSKDPYVDFQRSMEEMVETHGVNDWEGLEELLCWYLKVNGKSTHGFIVGAFVDLLLGLAFGSNSSCSEHSPPSSFYSSLSSSCSTRCVSCLEVEEEEVGGASSSLLLAQVKDEISPEDEASSSSSNN